MNEVEAKIDAQLGTTFEALTQAIDGMEQRDAAKLAAGAHALAQASNTLYLMVHTTPLFEGTQA